ncbi:MAG: MBL fold metallo-hydrolase [Nitrospiraceae bacterium]
MADRAKRLSTNVEGNFYVDSTCINCDTCRQLAPKSFQEVGEYSAVARQPGGDHQLLQAYQALLACPVGSIGTERSDKPRLQAAMTSFPLHLEGGVYYNGFNSEKSFGANSYFIEHPDGNWLIDSPRYLRHLVEAFKRMGGVRYIFLSHEDDVADASRYATEFRAARVIHEADAEAVPGAEWIVAGSEPVQAAPQFVLIPVPGHTPGSLALLYASRFCFTGDHMWWDRDLKGFDLPSVLLWRQDRLLQSTERLVDYSFEWVLPGHGERMRLSTDEMKEQLKKLLDRRRGAPSEENPTTQ